LWELACKRITPHKHVRSKEQKPRFGGVFFVLAAAADDQVRCSGRPAPLRGALSSQKALKRTEVFLLRSALVFYAAAADLAICCLVCARFRKIHV
jgi:hypothetical protein